MSELNGYNLSELFSRGTIYELADQYIQKCAETQTVDSEKNSDCTGNGKKKEVRKRFPNLAGFCRYLGTVIEELAETGSNFPKDYDALKAVFEDEAYNSNIPPSLLSVYFRQRFGIDGAKESEQGSQSNYPMGDIQIIFDHDMSEDGT